MNLSKALGVPAPTIIYGVTKLRSVLEALEAAARTAVTPIDCRSAPGVAELRHAAKGTGPVVVLLGSELQDETRVVLEALAESVKVVALTPSSAPCERMAALFPMQLAAVRVTEGGR
jgi:hypothetical protein